MWGIVFRVNNPRLSSHGRITIPIDDFSNALGISDKESADDLAKRFNGIVVPYERAERMQERRNRRLAIKWGRY